jgi:hypothetical protein
VGGFSRWATDRTARVLGWLVARYVVSQRDRLTQSATPRPEISKLRLRQYFSDADLDRVRILQADPLPIPDPPLYPIFRWLRWDIPEPSLTEAITFDHVVATRGVMNDQLLFHELVHAVQYRLLGLKTFARLYVRGFLDGGGYHDIPLERCAFHLDQRFSGEKEPFDVEAEVSKWISNGLF